jgi:transposase
MNSHVVSFVTLDEVLGFFFRCMVHIARKRPVCEVWTQCVSLRKMALRGHLCKCPLGEYVDTSERAVLKNEPRRRRSVAEKRRIVEETLEPDASVARVARAHGVNANQVFHWRRQYRQGLLGEEDAETVKLLPVHVSEALARKTNRQVRRQAAQATCDGSRSTPSGAIQVELPKGQLRITGRVDAEALRTVLEELLG